jgi:RNA polymerase sigma-70 factor (ECF subfamily)
VEWADNSHEQDGTGEARYTRRVQDEQPLAGVFRACRQGRQVEDDLERSLERMLADARAAWPGIAVTDEAYVRYVAERAPTAEGARLEDLHAADVYLACACAGGDAQAIAALDRGYLPEVLAILGRCGIERAVADEAVQKLRERLFVAADGKRAKIADYSGRGPLAGWLRVAATRAAKDLRRDEATRAAVTREAGPPSSMPGLDPELATIQRRYGDAFNRAFRDAFGALTSEERAVLRFYFVDGLNIERIGGALGLSRATVGRRMITARERLLAETLRLLGECLQATPTELESLLAIVRSKLEVSLGALIGPAPVEHDKD